MAETKADLEVKIKELEAERDAYKNKWEIVSEETTRYKRVKGEEMKVSFLINDFRKTNPQDGTPILDAMNAQGIDPLELNEFLKKYKNILTLGTAFEAFELHRSNVFPEIKNVAEALNQGQLCFSGFLTRFLLELQQGGSKIADIEPQGVETL